MKSPALFTLQANAGDGFCGSEKMTQHNRCPESRAGYSVVGSLDYVFESDQNGTRITLTYRVKGSPPRWLSFSKPALVVAPGQGLQLQGLANYLGND